MFKLYELSEAMNQVAAMMEDGVEGLEDTLESLDGSFKQKVENIIKLVVSKEAEAEMIDNEIERLTARSVKLKKDAGWLRDYVEREMKNANQTEVKSPLFKIKLRMRPPSVHVVDESKIPEKFYMLPIAKPVLRKSEVLEAFKNGEHVPGCEIKQDFKLNVK